MILKLEDNAAIRFNPTTLHDVRADYDLDKPGRIDEAVDLLLDWLKKQDHFVKKDFSRDYLERFLISAKGSVEAVKKRLDKVCFLRNTITTLYDEFDPAADYWLDVVMSVMMPNMTEDHHRIYLLKFTGAQLTSEILSRAFHYNMILVEYFKRHDYNRGVDIIYDVREIDLINYLATINLLDLRNFATIFIDGIGFRMRSCNILSKSKMADGLVTIFKQVLSEKLGKRINVHKTLDSLHKCLPKHYLPEDYGGDQEPLAKILETLNSELSSKEHVEYFNAMRLARTDESRRAPAAFNQHCLGMPGSFRTLTVD